MYIYVYFGYNQRDNISQKSNIAQSVWTLGLNESLQKMRNKNDILQAII